MPLYTLGSVALVSVVSLVGIFGVSVSQVFQKRALAFLVPLAVGALLGDAFFHLVPESFESGLETSIASLIIVLGIISFFFLEKFLRWHHHGTHADHEDEGEKHLASLILISDAFHNFIDGVIIGVSYLVSVEVGIATTIAVVLHEIPQEIGDFGVLLYAGFSKARAIFFNFLSALSAVLGALVVIIFGTFPEMLIEGVIPFAAGIFIYIAASDLVPELHRHSKSKNLLAEILGLGLGLAAMYLLLFLE